jgi:low temperature requirement protein LtrA
LWALFGGVALYLLAHNAFGMSTFGRSSSKRLLVAVLLVALTPLAAHLPALASLGVVAVLLVGLDLVESLRSREDTRGSTAAPGQRC